MFTWKDSSLLQKKIIIYDFQLIFKIYNKITKDKKFNE